MITSCLQSFTHRRQARLSPSGGLLVPCTPRQPLLGSSCEKSFCVFELNLVGMADVRKCHKWRSSRSDWRWRFSANPRIFRGNRATRDEMSPSVFLDYFGANPSTFWGDMAKRGETSPFAFLDYFDANPHTIWGAWARRGETSTSALLDYFGTSPHTLRGDGEMSGEMIASALLDNFGTNPPTFRGDGARRGEMNP